MYHCQCGRYFKKVEADFEAYENMQVLYGKPAVCFPLLIRSPDPKA